MIQVYLPGNTNYTSNGDMVILPESAPITCELNGAWTATIIHPLDDEGRWEALIDNAVVKMPSWNGEQLFRIRVKDTSDMDGIVCELDPIFYDAAKDCFLEDVRPTNKNGQQALDIMTAANTKYHAESNISVVSTAYYEFKNLLEAISGEEDNSFLNRWGGEIEYDNYTIRINSKMGSDKGFCFRYGRNIEGITETVDMSEVVTRIYPKAYNGRTRSGTKYIDSPLINAYPTIRSAVIEFDNIILKADLMDGSEVDPGATICETQAQLDAALGSACQLQFDAGLDKPVVTVLIEGVVPELEEFNAAKIELGDTVHLIHPVLGISSEARIVALTYDAIADEVIGVTIGQTAYNYFDGVSSAVNRIQTAVRPDGSVRAETVKGVVDMKQANLYAQYDQAEAQDVIGILFENNDSTSQLYGAMAIGTQGFMIADTKDEAGNWVWKTWGTAAGLNADYITAGTITASLIAAHSVGLNKLSGSIANNNWVIDLDNGTLTIGDITASNIKGGTLTLGGNNNVSGVLQVLDASGNVIGTWDKDGIDIDAGKIEIGNNFSVDSSGNLTANNATIGSSGTGYSAKIENGQVSLYYNNSIVGSLIGMYSSGVFGSHARFVSGPNQRSWFQLSDSHESAMIQAHNSDSSNLSAITVSSSRVNIQTASDTNIQNINLYGTVKIAGYEQALFPVLDITTPSFSSLPKTYYSEYITAKHEVPKGGGIELSNPSAQTGDWTITTADGSITISGSISGSTTAKFTLIAPTMSATATTSA